MWTHIQWIISNQWTKNNGCGNSFQEGIFPLDFAGIWIVSDRRDYILKVININQLSKIAALVSFNYWGVQQLGRSHCTEGFWPSPCSGPWSNDGLSLCYPVERSLREIAEQPMQTSSAQEKDSSSWLADWSPERAQPLAFLPLEKVYQ